MENPRIEILLVDDNDDDIFMIEEAFRDEDLVHISKAVQDGRAALAYLRNEGEYRDASRPSLVLLDINMPRTNGLEVLMMIKEDERLKTLPVVMLTTQRPYRGCRDRVPLRGFLLHHQTAGLHELSASR